MEIYFQCANPDCETRFQVDQVHAGRPLPCPNCGQVCQIAPNADGEEKLNHLNEALRETRDLSLRYTEEEELAQGGMGKVVLCRDKTIGRPVAMKVMQPEYAGTESQRMRFLEEAQITGQLEHPNIVPIHELGQDKTGNLYFTMKHIRGESLDDLIWKNKTGQVHTSVAEFLKIFLKICDGVAFAHSKGVIHRDIKPANIMVGDYGEVLVMDWGLAKIRHVGKKTDDVHTERLPESTLPKGAFALRRNPGTTLRKTPTSIQSVRSQTGMTKTDHGSIQGTPVYMAPEQALGMTTIIDHRTDVYALGTILYEMLTFKRPIEGKKLEDVLQNVADGVIVPPIDRTPLRNIPRDLSNICIKAMHRELDHRFQSVKELESAVTRHLDERARNDRLARDEPRPEKTESQTADVLVWLSGALMVLLILTMIITFRFKGQRDSARALALQSENSRSAAAEQLARMAILAEAEGNTSEANLHADAAVKVNPESPWGFYAWASLWKAREQSDKAIGFVERALQIDKDHRPSLALKAEIFAE